MEMIMSTMRRARAAAAGPPARSLDRSVAGVLKQWWIGRLERRLENLAIRELQTMSDRELRDMGIGRSQIASSVRAGRGRAPLHGLFF
jgi:uncharacterized protein YjiS (DUF1127 family)